MACGISKSPRAFYMFYNRKNLKTCVGDGNLVATVDVDFFIWNLELSGHSHWMPVEPHFLDVSGSSMVISCHLHWNLQIQRLRRAWVSVSLSARVGDVPSLSPGLRRLPRAGPVKPQQLGPGSRGWADHPGVIH